MKRLLHIILLVLAVSALVMTAIACESVSTQTLRDEQSRVFDFSQVYAMAEEAGYTGTMEELVELFKGDNAYQLAVAAGYTGTQSEWLASLVGASGKDGKDGLTPTIGENKHWFIGDVDTGIVAEGKDGKDGIDGKDGADGAQGIQGPQGEQGIQGEKGDKGDTGVTGNGIDRIEKAVSAGNVDAYTIYYTDGTTSTFLVTNGEKGDQGVQGVAGNGISRIEKTGSEEKVDTYKITFTDGTDFTFNVTNGKDGEQGIQGEKGDTGATGNGIKMIEKTSSDGNVDTYVITFTDDTTFTYTVTNGLNGAQGIQGEQGVQGEQGIQGEKGDKGDTGNDGRGISDVTINDADELVLTFTDGNTLNLGNMKGPAGENGTDGTNGKDGTGISTVTLSETGALSMTLSNGTVLDLGNVKGQDGKGIASSMINTSGELVLTYTDGSTDNLGRVTGTDGKDGKNGQDGKDGISILSVDLHNNDHLLILMSDGTVKDLGVIKAEKGDKGDQGEKGDIGETGVGITNTTVNSDGDLIITYSDGTTQNAGRVIPQDTSSDEYAIGSIVTMGKYEQDNNTSNGPEPIKWIVVQNTGDKALLLSQYVLEYMAMSNSSYGGSSVKSFLTGEFYDNAFTVDEKQKIEMSRILDPDGSLSQSTNTVFVLSYNEMTALSLNNIDLWPMFSDYVTSKGASVNDGVWLRDRYDGGKTTNDCFCTYRAYNGVILIQSPYASVARTEASKDTKCGVRPAMWISIKK